MSTSNHDQTGRGTGSLARLSRQVIQVITSSHRLQPLLPPGPTSFVPIPGAQQHKRPRRRYEEIERMYKCGWNGCEKAYGTLNHLNAHVTMQSHGQKRIPEEFKEIRKEWKARKKAEEAERKSRDEEQQRSAQAQAQNDQHDGQQPAVASYAGARLPPIGYQPQQYPVPPSAGSLPEYSANYLAAAGAYNPTSPYQQSHQQVYGQPNGGQSNH
ncbi:C2H2 finger domain transcription factor con7 [Diaporthe australafricana]|uniref:C2H2 finger domain transcription factor con7 n=1 Tax=Diaporthe australafricana TaxID=127596 RepID=A0ABR3X735_9PEZI